LGDLGDALGDSLRDQKFRDETSEAASALMNAFGATLTDLGEALKRDATTTEDSDS
jgi:hypothetical protein